MAILNNTDFELMQSNNSRRKDLQNRIGQIESQVIAWMTAATALHTDSHVDDKAAIIAMRDDLKARLQAAII